MLKSGNPLAPFLLVVSKMLLKMFIMPTLIMLSGEVSPEKSML